MTPTRAGKNHKAELRAAKPLTATNGTAIKVAIMTMRAIINLVNRR